MEVTQEIPYFCGDREFLQNRQTFLDVIDRVLSTGQVLQGRAVADLETKVAKQCGRKMAVAVNSCTDALYFALDAAGIGPGDDVLVTDFSFVASASCIHRAGARPVFVDVDSGGHMDLEKASSAVTPRTRAMIWVHLFGDMGPPAAVEAFARDHRIVLIEDAAQALGASRGGRRAGSLGRVSCVSFDPTKIVGAPGSGGMLLTDDPDIDRHVRQLRYHGKDADGRFRRIGGNSQMPTLTAAVLSLKLDLNDRWLPRRRAIAKQYIDGIRGPLILPHWETEAVHVFHKFVVQSDARDRLRDHLSARGVRTLIHYPTPLHRQPCFQPNDFSAVNETVSALTGRVLSLPIHPLLTDGEVDHVVKSVNAFWT